MKKQKICPQRRQAGKNSLAEALLLEKSEADVTGLRDIESG